MFKLLFKLLKVLIILLLLLALSIFFYQKGWLKSHPLQAQIVQFQDGKIKNLSDFVDSFKKEDELNLQLNQLSTNAGEQIKMTTQKALEAGKVAQEFVTSSIQTDESSEKNLGEKAFEYGQYIYCRAVVDDWEQKAKDSNIEETQQESNEENTEEQEIVSE